MIIKQFLLKILKENREISVVSSIRKHFQFLIFIILHVQYQTNIPYMFI